MSLFPASPTNGQTTTVNGTLYTYNSAQTAWIRTNAAFTNALVVNGNISVSGSLTSGNLVDAVGYKGMPQNARTSQYTLALSDMGFHISITTGGIIIPANSSVAFPIGSTVVVYNNSATTQTISITADTLIQAGTTTNTEAVVLDAYGLATLTKIASTVWVVSGNVTSLLVVNYLIVAGGGGSGSGSYGGGGGGGVLSGSAFVNVTSYAVTVGAAGTYAATPTNGGNSSIFGQTAIGGGAGGDSNTNGSSGGSGGGGGAGVSLGGAGTSGQGFAGGNGQTTPGGCGGGAGGVGGTGSSGNGGAAISSSITGSAVNYGGGGRGSNAGSTATSAYGEGAGANVGIGKAGVVIISYPTGSMTATGGTITTSGGNTIHTFTTSGTFQRTA
jgi:hypothetical protein